MFRKTVTLLSETSKQLSTAVMGALYGTVIPFILTNLLNVVRAH